MRALFSIAMLTTLLVGAGCNKADDKVEAKDVPAAVAKAVADRYPKGVVSAWTKDVDDKGVAEFEADVSIGDGKKKRELDVKVAQDGKILKEEEKLEFKSLPSEVRDAFDKSPYAKGKISKIEKAVKNSDESTTVYEIKLKDTTGVKRKILIDPHGKLTVDDDAKAAAPAANAPATPTAPESGKSGG